LGCRSFYESHSDRTAEGVDFSSVGGAVGRSSKKGAYNLSFEFKHNLQESDDQAGSSWGFYLKPARGAFDNALVVGLRMQLRF